jgi:hypothetical protein
MIICVICNVNAVCTECINFDLDKNNPEDIDFHCPMCFLKNNKAAAYVCGFVCISSCIILIFSIAFQILHKLCSKATLAYGPYDASCDYFNTFGRNDI